MFVRMDDLYAIWCAMRIWNMIFLVQFDANKNKSEIESLNEQRRRRRKRARRREATKQMKPDENKNKTKRNIRQCPVYMFCTLPSTLRNNFFFCPRKWTQTQNSAREKQRKKQWWQILVPTLTPTQRHINVNTYSHLIHVFPMEKFIYFNLNY